jgi:hypothetical protein
MARSLPRGIAFSVIQCHENRGGPVTRTKQLRLFRKWKLLVQDVNDKKNLRQYWEGDEAYEELQSKGFLEAVSPANRVREPDAKKYKDWRLWEAMEEITSQIRVYRRHQDKIVERNSNYRKADNFFKLISGRFKGEIRQKQPTEIKEVLEDYVKRFGNTRRRLKLELQQKHTWNPRGVLGRILTSHKYGKRPIREDDLDKIIQIRLAKIFRTWLRKPRKFLVRRKVSDKKGRKVIFQRVYEREAGISRRTIARLVVLTYMVYT